MAAADVPHTAPAAATRERRTDPVTGLPVFRYRFVGAPTLQPGESAPDGAWRVLRVERREDGTVVDLETQSGAELLAAPSIDDAVAAAALATLEDARSLGVAHGDLGPHRLWRRGERVWVEGYGVPWRSDATVLRDAHDLAAGLLALDGTRLGAPMRARLATLLAAATAATGSDALVADGPPDVVEPVDVAVSEVAAPAEGATTQTRYSDLVASEPVASDAATFDHEAAAAPEPDGLPAEPDGRAPDGAASTERAPDDGTSTARAADDGASSEATDDGVAHDDVAREATLTTPTVGAPLVASVAPHGRSDAGDGPPPPVDPIGPSPGEVASLERGAAVAAATPAPGPPRPPSSTPTPVAAQRPAALVRTAPAPTPEPKSRTPAPAARRQIVLAAALALATTAWLVLATWSQQRPVAPTFVVRTVGHVVDVRIDPAGMPPVSLLVVESPAGSRLAPGSLVGSVPSKVLLDRAGVWRFEARFDDRRSPVVALVVPSDPHLTLPFPTLPQNAAP